MSRFLQTLGAAALLGWTALGCLAWARTGSALHLTLQTEEGQKTNEVALIDDRLETLGGDVDVLVESLQSSLGQLVSSIQEETDSSRVARARLEERLAALEAALPSALSARETAGALASVLDRLDHLGASAPRGTSLLEPMEHEPRPGNSPGADDASPRAISSPTERLATPPVVPDLDASATSTSFLAFRLPSRDFQFAGAQDFEILGELSRVGFDAKSTLHDFTGVSHGVRGSFRVDLADTSAGITGQVEIDASSLDTGLKDRDEAMHEEIAVDLHPRISFEPTRLVSDVVDPEARTLSGTLEGRLTLHGITREVALGVSAHVDESRRLVVEGEMPLDLRDYEVPVPNKLGVITMENEVRIWIHLRSRAKRSVAQ